MFHPAQSPLPAWLLGPIPPKLDWDFEHQRYWGGHPYGHTTVTRALAALTPTKSGVLQSIPSGVLRITDTGLWLNSSRTNVVLWNRDLTNAAWTLGATMTSALNQTGADGATNSASSVTGGAVSATNIILQAITLGSSARAQSVWAKRLVGSGTVQMTMDGGTTWTTIVLTAAYQRLTIPTQTLANPSVGFKILTNGDSIAVDFVQNENGAYATSPIPTTTVAVTRPQDVIPLSNHVNLMLSGASVTVAVSLGVLDGVTASDAILAATGVGSDLYFDIFSAATHFNSAWNGDFQNSNAITDPTANAIKGAVAVGPSGFSIIGTGSTVRTDPGAKASHTAFSIGNVNGSGTINGPIKRLTIWNTKLSDAALELAGT